MPVEQELTRCEQCGELLTGITGIGCLNCMLRGGMADSAPELPNDFRLQHYELCQGADGPEEIGRGAMGVTYARATSISMRRSRSK